MAASFEGFQEVVEIESEDEDEALISRLVGACMTG